ncbi:MAG: hypothetical protein K0S81_2409 [Rhodospirillales bacterium]|jgi:hypothetical protein|nr:hypothetical protein [Rhodospirillales bacterium]
MMRVLAVLWLVLVPLLARAEEGWTIAVSGEVSAGEDFTAELPDGLVFVLEAVRQAPPNPTGWTIKIHKADLPDQDLVWPANPPYRFDNVRYLDTGYGKTPEQMLEWNPRRFSFYDDPAAAERATKRIEVVLWQNGDEPPARPDPKGIAVFNILESRIGRIGEAPAVIWMRFEARFSVEP